MLVRTTRGKYDDFIKGYKVRARARVCVCVCVKMREREKKKESDCQIFKRRPFRLILDAKYKHR